MRLELVETGRFNQRFRVHLIDGAAVEAVVYRGDTLCVSCQVGCAVGCPFCASGAQGLARPLELAELTAQVEAVAALGLPLQRVTISGVGEPLHNWNAVRAFIDYCRKRQLRPSLTTSGGPLPRLRDALHSHHNGLTISIHAGSESLRQRMVPHAPPLASLFEVLAKELPRLSGNRRRKTGLAYLALRDATDDPGEIDAFIDRALPLGLLVHLYAYNPVATSVHAAIDREQYESMYRRMTDAGLRVRMSSRARIESNGGCGTLVAVRTERQVRAG